MAVIDKVPHAEAVRRADDALVNARMMLSVAMKELDRADCRVKQSRVAMAISATDDAREAS